MSIQRIQQAICYMEEHIYENINYTDVAKSVHMSSYNFHRTFSFIAGMTANEYIRNRRLTLAAQELQTTDISVIDVAYKYGYESPESFSKAFSRFHGSTPRQAKQKDSKTHFNYGIGIELDKDTDQKELERFIKNGYSIWKTEPVDYAVFKCFGPDGNCLGETWSKFFNEFVPQTGYMQTDDTDYEIYFDNGESGLFCELWVPVKKN